MRIVRIESCSTSVMKPTAEQVASAARTALLLICRNAVKEVESTESASKLSRLPIEATAYEAIGALTPIRSLSSTLAKLSLKMSVIGV